jgi:hypothetical protein
VIQLDDWLERRARHQSRATALLGPYLRQRAEGMAHPVIDFLFTYYNLTPGQLRRWHPGYGVTLTGRAATGEYGELRGYRRTGSGVSVDPEYLVRRRGTLDYVVRLLTATAGRPANLGCFGLHEWAMLYRADPGQIRHRTPLRLGQVGTDAVVESMPLRCTHFDAYRFFTAPARPMNATEPTRSTQLATAQPGCLHAGMDLYRFAAKLLPLVSSDVLWEAFELAYEARELDMRASPYDLREYGYDPVPIETPAGRAEYVRQQSALSARAAVVRTSLLTACHRLLADADRRFASSASNTVRTVAHRPDQILDQVLQGHDGGDAVVGGDEGQMAVVAPQPGQGIGHGQ